MFWYATQLSKVMSIKKIQIKFRNLIFRTEVHKTCKRHLRQFLFHLETGGACHDCKEGKAVMVYYPQHIDVSYCEWKKIAVEASDPTPSFLVMDPVPVPSCFCGQKTNLPSV